MRIHMVWYSHRRSFAFPGGRDMKHPNRGDLILEADDPALPHENDQLQAHLRTCEACRKAVERSQRMFPWLWADSEAPDSLSVDQYARERLADALDEQMREYCACHTPEEVALAMLRMTSALEPELMRLKLKQ